MFRCLRDLELLAPWTEAHTAAHGVPNATHGLSLHSQALYTLLQRYNLCPILVSMCLFMQTTPVISVPTWFLVSEINRK